MTQEELDEKILDLNRQFGNILDSFSIGHHGGFADAREIVDIDQKERALDDLKEANELLLEAYRLLIGIGENYDYE